MGYPTESVIKGTNIHNKIYLISLSQKLVTEKDASIARKLLSAFQTTCSNDKRLKTFQDYEEYGIFSRWTENFELANIANSNANAFSFAKSNRFKQLTFSR